MSKKVVDVWSKCDQYHDESRGKACHKRGCGSSVDPINKSHSSMRQVYCSTFVEKAKCTCYCLVCHHIDSYPISRSVALSPSSFVFFFSYYTFFPFLIFIFGVLSPSKSQISRYLPFLFTQAVCQYQEGVLRPIFLNNNAIDLYFAWYMVQNTLMLGPFLDKSALSWRLLDPCYCGKKQIMARANRSVHTQVLSKDVK